MSDSELHQIALNWVGQLAAAGANYTQGSRLPEEWAEKLRQSDMLLQENESAMAKVLPKVTAYRKKHFQKIWEIVTGEKQHSNAFGYVLDRTDELWDLETAVGALAPKEDTAPAKPPAASTDEDDDDDDDYEDDEDSLESLKHRAQCVAELDTKAGMESDQQILDTVVDSCSDCSLTRDEIKKIVEPILQEERAKRNEEYKTWPAETDCDRLDKAFKDLDASGIKPFHHIMTNPSSAEMQVLGEMNEPENSGYRGCVWYHSQQTQAAVELGTLRLCYAPCKIAPQTKEEEDQLFGAIGKEIVDALAKHGLTSTWDGNSEEQIPVALNWQRRFPSKSAAASKR